MLFKDFTPTLETADGGSIVAYASTFDREPDSYGDIVAKGAFVDSLAEWEASGKPIPLLFGHRTDDPEMNIGAVTHAEEDEKGLRIEARFDADSEKAQYCRKLVKEGRLFKLSFAYAVKDSAIVELEDGTQANELRKLDIFEVSLVPIPANQNAQVVEVKSDEPEIKAGRVISAKNEDKLTQAAALINEVLAQLNSEASEDEGVNEKATPEEATKGDSSPAEASTDGETGALELDEETLSAFKKALLD